MTNRKSPVIRVHKKKYKAQIVVPIIVTTVLLLIVIILGTRHLNQASSDDDSLSEISNTSSEQTVNETNVATTSSVSSQVAASSETTTTAEVTTEITSTSLEEITDKPSNLSEQQAELISELDIRITDNNKTSILFEKILNHTDTKIRDISLYYYDLNTGDTLAINADRQFRSASTAKIFVAMAMYDAVAAGDLALDQVFYYTASDYEDGSGVMQNMDLTRGFTLAELADYSMEYSDNIAFQMIRRITGWDRVYDYYESIIGHSTDRINTTMSASDAYKLLKHAWQSKDPNMAHMLEIMRNTEFEQAIPRYLPDGIASNKIGFYGSYFHDAALIQDQLQPYILTIYTQDIATKYGTDPEELLAEISRIIYENR